MIKEYLKELRNKAKKEFKIKKKKMKIPIKYDLRSKRIIGQFCKIGKKRYFRFNTYFIEMNEEKYLETVKHEFAHLVASILYKNIKPHGKEWKEIMRKLEAKEIKATTKRYQEDIKIEENKNKIEGECKCQTHYLKEFDAKKIALGEKEFKCLKCKQKIILKK